MRRHGDPIGSFRFSACQRLRNQAEFEHVYQRGQRHNNRLFQITSCGNAAGFPRLGLSIAARAVGNAVSRNRIRRNVREVFRLHQHELPALDIIVSARTPARSASASELREELVKLLRSLK